MVLQFENYLNLKFFYALELQHIQDLIELTRIQKNILNELN